MLKSEYRLKKRSAFSATYKTRNCYHHNGISVFCGKVNTTNNPTKIGFVVSKKFHKRAVKRNRTKRLMRESVRILIKENRLKNKYLSLVFVASNQLLNKNYDYIDSSIKKIMELI